MFFFTLLRDLIKTLLSPLALYWILQLTVIVFYYLGKKNFFKWGLGLSLFWFLLISTPFLPKRLLATLENQYPPILSVVENEMPSTSNDSMVHILILGSGYEADDRLSYCTQLNTSGLARLTEGLRLLRILPESMLILSGSAGNNPLPEAVVSSLAAQELGIDPRRIATNTEPWNTKSEANEYFKHFGTAHKLFLVTDAAHMPRALMHFRNTGLNPIPAPTNFNIRKNHISKSHYDFIPSISNISYLELVFHEYLGMLWAMMGGN